MKRSSAVRLRFVAACALAVALTTGCSWFDRGDGDPGPGTAPTPPTARVFEQEFHGPVNGEDARVSVSTEAGGRAFRPGNIGLSFEATDLADPRLDPAASNLDELLNSLGSPALRFGGNALDRRTFWTSSGERPPVPTQTRVTPDDLQRLQRLVDATGSTVTIGVPLGDYDPARGADMAAHAVDILGESLVGIAIGNEPNGFSITDVPDGAVRGPGWNRADYVRQLEAYVDAIHAARPDAPIIGPDAYDGAWMDAFADAEVGKKTAISQHWYQLYDCDSAQVPGRGPRAANLVDPAARTAAKENLGIGRTKAEDAGLPLWLEETGPTSCPGTNDTSLTHAVSLWTADYTLSAASLGVERLAMHSMLGACRGGAPMSLVCDPADHGTSSYTFAGRPHFAALRLLVPSIGGTFTETAVSGGGNMRAYTVTKNDGRTLVTTIINANDAADTGGNPVTLEVPDGFTVDRAAQVHGPSIAAKNATSVIPTSPLPAEVPFRGTASPAPTPPPDDGIDDGTDNDLRIDLAASSATVLIMTADQSPRG